MLATTFRLNLFQKFREPIGKARTAGLPYFHNPRVFNQFENCFKENEITGGIGLIVAPPSSGKSVALSHYCNIKRQEKYILYFPTVAYFNDFYDKFNRASNDGNYLFELMPEQSTIVIDHVNESNVDYISSLSRKTRENNTSIVACVSNYQVARKMLDSTWPDTRLAGKVSDFQLDDAQIEEFIKKTGKCIPSHAKIARSIGFMAYAATENVSEKSSLALTNKYLVLAHKYRLAWDEFEKLD